MINIHKPTYIPAISGHVRQHIPRVSYQHVCSEILDPCIRHFNARANSVYETCFKASKNAFFYLSVQIQGQQPIHTLVFKDKPTCDVSR